VGLEKAPKKPKRIERAGLQTYTYNWKRWQKLTVFMVEASVLTGRDAVNQYQTVNDGVAHSKNPRKCAYHVTFDLDLEHILDAR